ncbi:MAG TPA: haloacid dehalogenase type II [Candidatus Nitrosotalea sp.]|jgi:2-haloacid dehalogenase|nr:haloacid dehalogenase type II [Candidatus Nitrosotalea sp.]
MDPASVSALTFDVFGTVVDWRSSIIHEGEAFGKSHRLTVDWPKFADAWRGLYQPAMEEVRSGRRPWVRLDDLHRESLVRLLGDFGITGLSPAEIDHLNRAWHRLDPWPDAVPGLTRLKRRFILATLSNGNIALMVNMAKRGGLPWDAILGAEVARAYKPAPEAYLRSAEALGLAPEQCLMVAAHPGDLAAAARCGLRSAHVPRPLEFGPGRGASKPEPAQPFDIVAGDFVELAERLGC